jgi:hypothetical protein
MSMEMEMDMDADMDMNTRRGLEYAWLPVSWIRNVHDCLQAV